MNPLAIRPDIWSRLHRALRDIWRIVMRRRKELPPSHVWGPITGWLLTNCPDGGFWVSPITGRAFTQADNYADHLAQNRALPEGFQLPAELRRWFTVKTWRRVPVGYVMLGGVR